MTDPVVLFGLLLIAIGVATAVASSQDYPYFLLGSGVGLSLVRLLRVPPP